jgi:hypothetical protein
MAPMPMLVSLHSPLVGPLTWQPAAASLRAAGYHVAVPSLTGVVDTGPPYYRKLAGRVAETIRQANPARAVVLIGHSGAGALLPAAADATGTPVAAAMFVDAILPHPGVVWFDTAPQCCASSFVGPPTWPAGFHIRIPDIRASRTPSLDGSWSPMELRSLELAGLMRDRSSLLTSCSRSTTPCSCRSWPTTAIAPRSLAAIADSACALVAPGGTTLRRVPRASAKCGLVELVMVG